MNKFSLIILFIFLICLNNLCFAQEYYYYLESQDEKLIELYKEGNELRREKKYKESIECYEKAYQLNPNDEVISDRLSKCKNTIKKRSNNSD